MLYITHHYHASIYPITITTFIITTNSAIMFSTLSQKLSNTLNNITGKGHSTMALGEGPCITATVVLTDQEPRIGKI